MKAIGLQPDSSWVMANNVYMSSKGEIMNSQISDYYSGPGIPYSTEHCSIELPVTTDPLKRLMNTSFTFTLCLLF